ncbi:MAG: AMP-binding protein [Pirellulaceae bacterium]|nr:AMP-binding protein [Pirellulaceae bacterium]
MVSHPPYPEISEAERFPLLSPAGQRLLHAMRQDSRAPIWNWPNGEQLDAAGLAEVHQFAQALQTRGVFTRDQLPAWLPEFLDFCLEEVPFYRRRAVAGTPLAAIPSCSREDLAPRPWEFVPDSQSLDRLIVFHSSGTTGHPAALPTHPATAACGIPLLERALAPLGLTFPRGPEQIALTNITAYPGAYSTAIVVAYLQEAGCVRVNLCPQDWRQPGDCLGYLDRWRAPVMLGDPIAFAAWDRLGLQQPPQVLVSCIMALSDALAADLSARYGCQVLDLYAMTETGIVAVGTPNGHAVLPHDLYIEILDEHDQPCTPGLRGEVTVTGGRNPFAPLLRYRTGDFASLAWQEGKPILVGLEGRRPVLFPTADGRLVHSMEVSRLLRRFPLTQFQLHQAADGVFHFQYRGRADAGQLRLALQELLGRSATLTMAELLPPSAGRRQVIEYRTDVRTPVLDRLLPTP